LLSEEKRDRQNGTIKWTTPKFLGGGRKNQSDAKEKGESKK